MTLDCFSRGLKQPRPSRSLESMPICKCGQRAKVAHSSDWRNALDRELGQVSRMRVCLNCGNAWRTVEIRESELQALRLDAYRWRNSQEPRAVPVPLSP